MGRPQIHIPRMRLFLEQHGAATLRQLVDAIGCRSSFAYRPMRAMRDAGITSWAPLDEHLGAASQQVAQLSEVARERLWTDDELQMADTHLQARAQMWDWIYDPAAPQIRKGGYEMRVIGPDFRDHVQGQSAARRLLDIARKTGHREITYTDHDVARARRVRDTFRGTDLRVHTPWRPYRDRPDPRLRE